MSHVLERREGGKINVKPELRKEVKARDRGHRSRLDSKL
jgi:hypothetical protein